METLHRGITLLLRSAITGEKLSLPEGFTLEAADELIRAQSLMPMAYLGAYNCGISTKSPLMMKYQQLYFGNMLRNQRQMQAVERIFQAFEAGNIDYLPLKGCILKPLYPNPEMRIMGDADILIRMEQYDKIRSVMENLEFREGARTSYDVNWSDRNLVVELHYQIFGKEQKKLAEYFVSAWDRAVNVEGNHYSLTTEDHYLQIFMHMTKHFLHWGIGARQFVDLFVYRRAHPEMDEAVLDRILSEVGVRDFHSRVMQMLDVWFGDGNCDRVTDAMTSYVFSSGNWGSMETNMVTEALGFSAGDVKGAAKHSLFRAIFPELSYMQPAYNILFDHPWLYPVFVVVRWFDVLLNRRKNIGKRLRIIRSMKSEKVDERKQFLEAVGLRFFEE